MSQPNGHIQEYRKIVSFESAAEFAQYAGRVAPDLLVDTEMKSGESSPLAAGLEVGGRKIGNRFCVLPMEGWDGTADGKATDFTVRRWQRFGQSGAKLIFGGEAVAIRQDGRANPLQLMMNQNTLESISNLRRELVEAHSRSFGKTDDLLVGIQLSHSGRYAKPNRNDTPEPVIAYRHPILDRRMKLAGDYPVLSDDQIYGIINDFVAAAELAQRAGFDFIDVKHCHGYLGHEMLSAFSRPGAFGGSFENRTRFLREIVSGIRRKCPGMMLAVRLSAIDFVPFRKGADGVGEPDWPGQPGKYDLAFGGDGTGLGYDLTEPLKFLDLLESLGIKLVCITCGSPYYNPHVQRPAYFPPSDGYLPPEDPLVGVARQIKVAAELKRRKPRMIFVGSAYSCLQEYLPHVAQAAVSKGMIDSVGLGRMALPYPDIAADILSGRPLDRRRICRTISDCTTAPRCGIISGCYPLDEYYKKLPECQKLKELRKGGK